MLGTLPLMSVDEVGVDWGLASIDGWGASGTTLSPEQRRRQDGAIAGQSFRKPRSIVLSGDAVVPDPSLASAAVDRLISAASLEGAILTVTEAGSERFVVARRDGEVAITWPAGSATYFRWSVQLVALDPRKLAADLTTTTGLPSTTGGLTIPFTVPFTINAVTVTGQVSLTNPGNIAGPVGLRIDGPVTGPIVTHVSSGRSLVFASSLVLAAGEFVTVDMEKHLVLAQGQSSRAGWVTQRGWSQFEPGVNTWAFSALTHSPTASLTVTATPAWQ